MSSAIPTAWEGGPPSEDAERRLLQGLRAGRRDAFETLYRQHRDRIFNLALRMVQSPEDARDITHDVFVKAMRRFPAGPDDLKVSPWLYRVAVNACYDHLRQRRRHGSNDGAAPATTEPTVDAVAQAELSLQLERTLAGLPRRQRAVLLLKDVHGLPHEEIAGILGTSRGAAEALLFRARSAFRRTFEALSGTRPTTSCELARLASVRGATGELSSAERHQVTLHARSCPECAKTVKTWGAGGGVGLTTLATVAAKVGGALSGKVALVAATATCVVAAGGVTAYSVDVARQARGSAVADAVAAQRSGVTTRGASAAAAAVPTVSSAGSGHGEVAARGDERPRGRHLGLAKGRSGAHGAKPRGRGKALGRAGDRARAERGRAGAAAKGTRTGAARGGETAQGNSRASRTTSGGASPRSIAATRPRRAVPSKAGSARPRSSPTRTSQSR